MSDDMNGKGKAASTSGTGIGNLVPTSTSNDAQSFLVEEMGKDLPQRFHLNFPIKKWGEWRAFLTVSFRKTIVWKVVYKYLSNTSIDLSLVVVRSLFAHPTKTNRSPESKWH